MSVKTLLTADEFEKVCGSFGSCELVRGEIVQMSPGGFRHSSTVSSIDRILGTWARKSGLGRTISCEAGVVVETDPDTVRGADVAYISYARLPKGKGPKGFTRVAPELVVEVLGIDRTWKDAFEKAGEYFRMGVLRVWIADPQTQRVHALRPDEEPQVFQGDDMIADEAVLPGFSCRVSEFFED